MLSMRTFAVTLLVAAAAAISTISTITLLIAQLSAQQPGQQHRFTGMFEI
jgi:hypothetical protein